MAFQLSVDKNLWLDIQRAIRTQLKRARQDCRDLSAPEAVHNVRKRCKRVRALARLLRNSIGKEAYHVINTVVRDAARPLIGFRDAEVMMATLEKLEKEHSQFDLGVIRLGLEARSERVQKEVLKHSVRHSVNRCLKHAHQEAATWQIAASKRRPSRELARMHAVSRNAYAAASIDPSVEKLHEWRKQAKYLGNQVQFLIPLRPRSVKPVAERLHRLTDLLGDDHDLAVFAQVVMDHQEEWHASEVAVSLIPILHPARERLQKRAFELGAELFGPTADDFAQRLTRRLKAKKLSR